MTFDKRVDPLYPREIEDAFTVLYRGVSAGPGTDLEMDYIQSHGKDPKTVREVVIARATAESTSQFGGGEDTAKSGVGFCTDCGERIESFDALSECPYCGTTGLPCADEEQVTVSVNWHELRILAIWAENYQRTLPEASRVVYAIAKRLQAQQPDRVSLTLAGELGEIAKTHEISVNQADLRRDIAEQTGEETGLFRPHIEEKGDDGY